MTVIDALLAFWRWFAALTVPEAVLFVVGTLMWLWYGTLAFFGYLTLLAEIEP